MIGDANLKIFMVLLADRLGKFCKPHSNGLCNAQLAFGKP